MLIQTAVTKFDFERIAAITKCNASMLLTMHKALSDIALCEVSLDGGIAQKHIAETALVEVYKTARNLEARNG